ncbi:protein eyes shut homolog [Artibeus jamaicensis]|uniref:protein eyes shut homolog n=1 Tax=Artibeus jamaicensis TaxID=9417 RepID=UPI00235B2D32|nr:protein eyes shut homolog [Artibeus jamaicensis]
MPRFTGKNSEKVIDHCRLLSINCLNEEWCFNIIGRFRDACTRNSCWFLKNICLIYLYPCYCGSISHDICQAEVPHSLQLKYVWQLGFTVFEGEKYEVTIDAYSFHAENCTDDAVYMNKSEDLGYLHLFQCEEPKELKMTFKVVGLAVLMCANGCSCLTEEDSKEYFCLCIHRRPRKMNQKNTTDYQESGCQPKAVHDAAVLSVTLTESVFSTLEIASETGVHHHMASAESICTAVTVAVCKYIKEKSVKQKLKIVNLCPAKLEWLVSF